MALARIHTLRLMAWVGMAAACMGGKVEDTQGGGEGGETTIAGGSGPIGGSPFGGVSTGGVTFVAGAGGEAWATGGFPGGGLSFGGEAGAPSMYVNWGFAFNTEGWSVSGSNPVGVVPILSWDDSTGNPSPGSLHLEINFHDVSQWVRVSAPVDSPGSVDPRLSANLRFLGDVAIADSAQLPTARLYVRTAPESVVGLGPVFTLYPGVGWINITFNPAAPVTIEGSAADYDPLQVTEIGVEIATPQTALIGLSDYLIDTVQD